MRTIEENILRETCDSKFWNKAKNLLKLKDIEDRSLFVVPEFICLEEKVDIDIIKKAQKSFKWKNLAVRSSSNLEDSEDNSFAWSFETILWVEPSKIEGAIKKIHSHSREKHWIDIPVIIQEMVEDVEISWVCFNQDVDEWKPYFVINYHNGLWDWLVWWESSWKTVKISTWIDSDSIENEPLRKIINAARAIKGNIGYDMLDIEFAYSKWILYLLQVRPITVSKSNIEADKLTQRYSRFISHILNKRNVVLWDMIDINPQELVWNTNIFTKTLFKEVFPWSSLTEARNMLWYSSKEDFSRMLLDKLYIDLEKNLESFLPKSLNKNEKEIFYKYFKSLLSKNPTLQSELDSVQYPINLETTKDILDKCNINEENKIAIIWKFEKFFSELEKTLVEFASKYSQTEEILLSMLWCDDFLEACNADLSHKSPKDITNLLKIATKYFTIYARWAFYFSSKLGTTKWYFEENMYSTKIAESLKNKDSDSAEFKLPAWFDIFSEIKCKIDRFTDDSQKKLDWNTLDIFLVARENIKFIFMLIVRELWKTIMSEATKKWISPLRLKDISFNSVIETLEWSRTLKNIELEEKRNIIRKKIAANIIMPPVFNKRNNLEIIRDRFSAWYYIGSWNLEWEVIYVSDISKINKDEVKGKILLIENATPEIDGILANIRWIITRNWWPLAHIAIRARELSIPAVVWIWEDFTKIIPSSFVRVDFNSKKLTSK